ASRRARRVVLRAAPFLGTPPRLDRPAGLAAVFEAKARPSGMALPVLVSGLDQARALALLDDRAEALAGAFWPGALTIVLARSPSLTATIGGDGTSVGLRVPRHPALALLLADTGPLATHSANPSGRPTPEAIREIQATFGDAVAVYLDGGPARPGPPST